jgi:glycine cleavage system H protein
MSRAVDRPCWEPLVSDFEYPDDLRYTAEHEWVRSAGDVVRVGITAFAQDALGDIVFVTLPADGEEVQAGVACGEVESTKSVSDIYAPIAGTVVRNNPALDATPELVNSDPYGEGWMFELRPADADAVAGLLSAADYQAQLG